MTLKVAKIFVDALHIETNPCWVAGIPLWKQRFFRVSQVSEDREDPLFGITFTDGLEQKGRRKRHSQVPSLTIILTKLSGEKLLY